MGNELDLMTGKVIELDIEDENGKLKGVYKVRCMNCGETGRFVPTLDWGHLCCVKCTCVLADNTSPTEVDMKGAKWLV